MQQIGGGVFQAEGAASTKALRHIGRHSVPAVFEEEQRGQCTRANRVACAGHWKDSEGNRNQGNICKAPSVGFYLYGSEICRVIPVSRE